MKRTMTSLLLLAGIILLAGCQKEVRVGNDKGLIRFGATSVPETKATYSGELDNAKYERIDWEAGDNIRIWSPEASDRYHATKNYADYKVSKVLNPEGRLSKAEIINSDITFDANGFQVGVSNPAADEYDNVNGLVWGDAGTYKFYASYPVTADGTMGTITGSLPAKQTLLEHTYTNPAKTIWEPDDTAPAYMTAATKVTTTSTITQINQDKFVTLEFEPAFTAFEISFESQDVQMTVTKVELSSTSTDLTGKFAVKYTENESGSTTDFTKAFQFTEAGTKNVYAELGNGLSVSPGNPQTVTLFALPKDQTDLTLTFTVIVDGVQDTRSLKLSYAKDFTEAGVSHTAGEFIVFTACKKHRITNIKMPNNVWQTIIEPFALPWQYIEKHSNFSENVQSSNVKVDGMTEYDDEGKPKNHYEAFDTKENNEFLAYEEWVNQSATFQATYMDKHPTYYSQYYQIRTMDMNKTDTGYPRFDVSFTPTAPYAGYWNLSVEAAPSYNVTGQGGPEGFRIVLWDGESELDDWMSGQIMNQEVSIRIYPSASRDPRKEYCMLFKAYFSPNKNGEPTYSADSEMQDVHSDGRFSYWKFVIPATQF